MINTAHEPEMSFVPSAQTAGRGVHAFLHGSMFCCNVDCLVNLVCTFWKWKKAVASGELGTGAGRRNLNSVPYFDTNLQWDHRKVIMLFCLLLQPLPALLKQRLALCTSLSVQAS